MYSATTTAAHIGLHGYNVDVEVHIANGLPRFKIVGLPDKSVEEAKERVTAAIKSSGYTFPLKRITVNLSPTDIPKHGSSFDLPIAIGILSASGQIPAVLLHGKTVLLFGELGLDGSLRETPGAPIRIETAQNRQGSMVICPNSSLDLTQYFPDTTILHCSTLSEVVQTLRHPHPSKEEQSSHPRKYKDTAGRPVITEIAENSQIRRSLLISAAGWHHIGIHGPPGTGKTLHAHSMIDILPPMDKRQMVTLLKIYDLQALPFAGKRPFRAPHHSISPAAMFGTSTPATPGEISLAHTGVLLLDEFPDFKKEILLTLRSVLDSRKFLVRRHNRTIPFPADFLMITTMNNCPCGYFGHPMKKCTCSPPTIARYQAKIPGALDERIDMDLPVSVGEEAQDTLRASVSHTVRISEITEMKERIKIAWERQKDRGKRNSMITVKDMATTCKMTGAARNLLKETTKTLGLSMRGYLKTVRIARTISDIAEKDEISDEHIAEAVSYRTRK